MSERECEYHGALTITWDTDDIPDVDGEPRCYVCELEKEKSNLTHVRIPKLEILLGKTVKRADDLQAKLDAAEKQLGTFKKASETYRDGLKDVSEQNEDLKTRLDAAEKERDLAIAHDTQPYPTAQAYEKVCKLLHEKESKIKRLEGALMMISKMDDCIEPECPLSETCEEMVSVDDCCNRIAAQALTTQCKTCNDTKEVVNTELVGEPAIIGTPMKPCPDCQSQKNK